MGAIWSFISKAGNRTTLGWLGGGIVVVLTGGWAVVTYVWPADGAPKVVCAQDGSIAAGHDASGNTVNYSGAAPADKGAGAACGTSGKP